jgi:hypothetical protein
LYFASLSALKNADAIVQEKIGGKKKKKLCNIPAMKNQNQSRLSIPWVASVRIAVAVSCQSPPRLSSAERPTDLCVSTTHKHHTTQRYTSRRRVEISHTEKQKRATTKE